MILRVAYGAQEGPSLVGIDGPIVVIDALRMSATVIVACWLGMEVVPVRTSEEALTWGKRGALTAGERNGVKIPELDIGNSPTTLLQHAGQLPWILALTTSNGVPALLSVAEHKGEILVGSPLNLSGLSTCIKNAAPHEIGILLAGRRGVESMEDEMTASLLVTLLGAQVPDGLPTPVSPEKLGEYFANTYSGRKLTGMGYAADVRLCSGVDRYPLIPRLIKDKAHPLISAKEVNNV